MGRQHPLDVFRSSRDGFDKASKRRTVAGKVIASSVKVKSKLTGSSSTSTGSGSRAAGKPKTKTAAPAKARAPVKTPGKAPAASSSMAQSASSSSSGSRISRTLSGAKLFAPGPGGKKKRTGVARGADGATRTIFFGAIVMLSAVVLVVVFKQLWMGDGLGELPAMKLAEVLPDGPGTALAPQAERAADLAEAGALATPDRFTIRAAVYNGSERGMELAVAAHEELVLRGLPAVTLVGNLAADLLYRAADPRVRRAG